MLQSQAAKLRHWVMTAKAGSNMQKAGAKQFRLIAFKQPGAAKD
jgi:hypothetical protein